MTDEELNHYLNQSTSEDEKARLAKRIAASAELQARLRAILAERTINFQESLQALACEELQSTTLPTASAQGNQPSQKRRIGNYVLQELIGQGGMGQVWRAAQERPVRRMVAIKLIKRGIGSDEVLRRFEAERQALAMMSHPSIASILDGGSDEFGQPYFVMELVDGVPITQYCEANHLGLRERLAIFRNVCEAIQHAHQKGIIHRDLKPSNILVAQREGQPVTKVIDFGLAKALDRSEKLTDASMLTEYGAIIGTLQYMSPEQADLTDSDVDTRADIYSLGVLLYELLTGSTPLHGDSMKQRSVLAILESIREEDPPKPSDRLLGTESSKSRVRTESKTEGSKWRSSIRGDLDWIVMKAIDKTRERRYDTAKDFANDINRYLDGLPVLACPPSARYKIGKLIKKNRASVAAASVMILLLVGGLIGTSLGLRQATLLKVKAQESETLERSAKEEAKAAFDVLLDAMRSTDPDQPVNSRSVVDILKAAQDSVGNRALPDSVRRSLLLSLGESYLSLGLGSDSIRILTALQSIPEATKPDPQVQLRLEYLDAMGTADVGQFDEAIAKIDSLLQRRENELSFEQRKNLEGARIECTDGSPFTAMDDLIGLSNWLKKYYQTEMVFNQTINWGSPMPIPLVKFNPKVAINSVDEVLLATKDLLTKLSLDQGLSGREATMLQLRLAAYLSFSKRNNEAFDILKTVEQSVRQKYGNNHPRLAQILWLHGTINQDKKAKIRESYEIYLRNFGPSLRTQIVAESLLFYGQSLLSEIHPQIRANILKKTGLSDNPSFKELIEGIQKAMIQSQKNKGIMVPNTENAELKSGRRTPTSEEIEEVDAYMKAELKAFQSDPDRQLKKLEQVGLSQSSVDISDVQFAFKRVGWGELKRDTNLDGKRIRIADQEFSKGIFAHAPSSFGISIFPIQKGWSSFSTKYGLLSYEQSDWSPGSVAFSIYGDEKLLFQSPVIRDRYLHEVTVDIRGVLNLRLQVSDGGDGLTCDNSVWAMPTLHRELQPSVDLSFPTKPPTELAEGERDAWQYFDSLNARIDLTEEASLGAKQIKAIRIDRPETRFQLDDFQKLSKLNKLLHCNLANTMVDDNLVAALGSVGSLEHLNLWNTPVSDKGIAALSKLSNLKFLNLGLTKASLKALEEMPLESLDHLFLNRIAWRPSTLKQLTRCKQLKWLSLSETELGDADLQEIRELKSLRVLYVNSTKISDVSMPILLGLPQLEMLDVSKTSLTEGAIELLTKKLPNCRISR